MATIRVASAEVVAYAEANRLDLTTVQGTGTDGRITLADAKAAVAATPYVTPLVAKLAAEHRVDLRAVAGTGVAGRIRKSDVLAAAGVAPPEANGDRQVQEILRLLDPSASAARSQSASAKGPAFARNPLVDQARASAAANGQSLPYSSPPTLFAAGDVPSFTASGVPADSVLDVPWMARHALAAAPTAAAAYEIVQQCAGNDGPDTAAMLYSQHDGNQDYAARVEQWLVSGMTDAQLNNSNSPYAYAEMSRRRESRFAEQFPADEAAALDNMLRLPGH